MKVEEIPNRGFNMLHSQMYLRKVGGCLFQSSRSMEPEMEIDLSRDHFC